MRVRAGVRSTIAVISTSTLAFGPAGCAWTGSVARPGVPSQATVAQVWFSAIDPTPPYREDGEGPFPAAWPAAAVVVAAEPIEYGVAEATLFLLAAKDLTEANAASRIPSAARFAKECRLPARGRWVSLTGSSLPVFVLLYDSGGTAGSNVEVFSRLVWFSWPTRHSETSQNHWFERTFRGQSRLPPYLADTDQDESLELLVASEVSNSSGAEGTPRIYDVWAWRDGKFERVGELPEEKVESLSGRIRL
jgi:hypothetical protein